MTADAALASSRSDAQAVLKAHGRSFHFASHFLGPRHGARAARLYAFCRHVDDLVDEASSEDDAFAGLQRLDMELSGSRPPGEAASDFLRLADETRMDLRPARALIEGVRSDLGPVAFETDGELDRYAYHVAGVVGLMMCAVLDVEDMAARPFAIDLGIAMQLTNIARDVGEDAAMGRRYLPADWVGALDPRDITRPNAETAEKLREGVDRLLDRAETFYRSGEAGLGYLPPRARFAILIAARTYRAIGGAVQRMNFESWRARARVSGPRKLAIASRAAGHFALSRRLHRPASEHNAALHSGLRGLAFAHPPEVST